MDLDRDTWADACSFAFRNAVNVFPPKAADIRPAVVFRNRLFSGEELADTVSVRGDVPMSPVQQLTDMGVSMIPPVAGRPVQRTVSGSVGWDVQMEKVGGSVGQSCFRMNSEETLPVSQDAYDDCGDDRFSPGISDRMSLNCHVDINSLWMVHWEDRRTVETGSSAGVSAWRSALCGIARLSCLPVFPANHGLECLNYLGRNCIMDLSAGGTLSPSEYDLTGPNGPNGPYVTGGPVGQIGTLSPSTFSSEILVDPGGRLPSADRAGMLLPAIPVGRWGTLPPSDSDPAGPDGPSVTLVAPSANLGRCPHRPSCR